MSWLSPEALGEDEWGIIDEDDSDRDEGLDDFLFENGTDGFVLMLMEISHHLESPLVVLCEHIDTSGPSDEETAIAYVVYPGSLDVEVFNQDDPEWEETIDMLDDELEVNVVYKAIPPGSTFKEGIFAILLV
jgi:hypothetical protein